MGDVEVDRRAAAAGTGPVIVHCRYVTLTHTGLPTADQVSELTPLPTLLCLQRRDRPDGMLHRNDDWLSAAAAGGSGGRAEHHLPTPGRQVRTGVTADQLTRP